MDDFAQIEIARYDSEYVYLMVKVSQGAKPARRVTVPLTREERSALVAALTDIAPDTEVKLVIP